MESKNTPKHPVEACFDIRFDIISNYKGMTDKEMAQALKEYEEAVVKKVISKRCSSI